MRACVDFLVRVCSRTAPTQPTACAEFDRSKCTSWWGLLLSLAHLQYAAWVYIYHTIRYLHRKHQGVPSLLHCAPYFVQRACSNVHILSDKYLSTKSLYWPSVCAEQLSTSSLEAQLGVSATGASFARLIVIIVNYHFGFAVILMPSRNCTCWHMPERELHAIQQQALAARAVVRILLYRLKTSTYRFQPSARSSIT